MINYAAAVLVPLALCIIGLAYLVRVIEAVL